MVDSVVIDQSMYEHVSLVEWWTVTDQSMYELVSLVEWWTLL